MSTADFLNQDFGDESEEDFNPEPERNSDDEDDAKPDTNGQDDDDEPPQRSRGGRDADNEDDDLKEEPENKDGEDEEEGGDEEEEEDEEDEEEDEEDDDDEVCIFVHLDHPWILIDYRINPRASAEESRGATSSSMSKPKSTRRMRRSPKRTKICLAKKCTQTTFRNSLLARTVTTASTVSSTVSATCRCTLMQRRRLRG